MKARELKRIINKIDDDVEILLDDFYGNGILEIDPNISFHKFLQTDQNTNSSLPNIINEAYIISFVDNSEE